MKPDAQIKHLKAINNQVLELARTIVALLAEKDKDIPIQVGVLNRAMGMAGFHKCEPGHPVFQLKDKYIIYMHSDTEKLEKVYDAERQVFNNYIGYYTVGITYYKETLKPAIDFNPLNYPQPQQPL